MPSFANLVRSRRQSLHLTLDQLAHAAGCSKAYLSAIENDRLHNPPSRRVIESLQLALGFSDGQLTQLANWQRISSILHDSQPATSECDSQIGNRKSAIGNLLLDAHRNTSGGLDSLYRSGQLQQWIDHHAANVEQLSVMCYQVPLINKVAAGYPREFTDLDYPARVADEYVSVPGLTDPDSFAARVVGNSMHPDYHEGDIVVFSPSKSAADGDDCFIRLLPEHRTTFKRIFFESESHIRLQPLNPAYHTQTVALDHVAGLYPAVYRLQRINPPI